MPSQRDFERSMRSQPFSWCFVTLRSSGSKLPCKQVHYHRQGRGEIHLWLGNQSFDAVHRASIATVAGGPFGPPALSYVRRKRRVMVRFLEGVLRKRIGRRYGLRLV